MLKSRSSGRGFLLTSAMAALLTMTVAPAAKALAVGSNLSVSAIGLSKSSTTLAYVRFSGSNITGQNCTVPPGEQGQNMMFFDFTTTRGKAIMSLLTAAQLAGKKVSILGNNTCLTQQVDVLQNATMESINWVEIK
jgi:hypothetical protein